MTQPAPAPTVMAAAAALRSGKRTSEELTLVALNRIAATDANVQAWAHVDREHALALARSTDALRSAGVDTGRLAGIGIGVKDLISTGDQPTQLGSPIFAGARPAFDADCIVRLKRAGGFVFGKTTTTEFGFMQPGKTRNPWNAAHTPGGSSSGSAAAVALGQVSAALGTQTNGSVIRPAAYCGVVGFKPTRDALPFEGVSLFSPTVDTLGVFARTVADCALVAGCLAGGDFPRSTLTPLTRAPRLAWLADFPWVVISAEQRAAGEAAVDVLRRDDASVTTVALPDRWREAHLVHRCITFHEGAGELGALQESERQRMSAKLNAALDEGRAISAATYAQALAQRNEAVAALRAWLEPYDAIVAPPAPGIAPGDLTQTGDPSCCTLWSLLGFPAISIPVGLASNGLPLGLQFAAAPRQDDRLLAVAHWCEARLPFKGLV
jgi:Asp-tRNA(Asn)/Glu-tRNA(Gln) amidotransferase A subunit family amidase